MSDANAGRPDLTKGVSIGAVADGGMLLGRAGDDDVLLARVGDSVFAVGAHCTHYHGALADGLLVGDTVRCPLHHACFNLRSGEAVRAPALDPIACWRVERDGDTVFVREKLTAPEPVRVSAPTTGQAPASVGIVGGGAAALAAADMLRREGYGGAITMISADQDPPVDRPNLSKDYLAGEAKDDWIPFWPAESYAERRVELLLGRRVTSLDAASRTVVLDDGSRRAFGAILLATGADPVKLPIPGADEPHVLSLRSFADSRALVARAGSAKHVVVVGASFIGLEVSASLRARGIAVDVVAPDQAPLERVMGLEVGRFIQSLHEAQGVAFHLGQTVTAIEGRTVTLGAGGTLDADFVVMGVGVRPAIALAQQAGLALDRGIVVNEYLETSAPGIFAAGDVARWPDPHTGDRIRVEHWVVAERQGQAAARNILGRRERFDAVPFFWSQHYDVTIRYVGHAEPWDAVTVDGAFQSGCSVTYSRSGRRLAVATIGRDRESLDAEVAIERTWEYSRSMSEDTFKGLADFNIFFRSWRPEGRARAVVVIVPGFNSHSGYYAWVAAQLVARGLAVYALDLRGRGKSDGERFYVQQFGDYVADVATFVTLVKSRERGLPLFLLGHSAGGVVACLYALDHQAELSGLICESFAFKVPAPDFALAVLKGLSHIAPHAHVLPLKTQDFSRDPAVVAAMNADPLIAHETQPTQTVAAMVRADERLDVEFPRITLPVLILHGTQDKATKPSGSQRFYDTTGSTDKTLKLYEGAYHDLLNDIDKATVMADITGWIDARLPPA